MLLGKIRQPLCLLKKYASFYDGCFLASINDESEIPPKLNHILLPRNILYRLT